MNGYKHKPGDFHECRNYEPKHAHELVCGDCWRKMSASLRAQVVAAFHKRRRDKLAWGKTARAAVQSLLRNVTSPQIIDERVAPGQ